MSQQINLYEERLRPRHDLATTTNLGIAALALLVLMAALAVVAQTDANRKSQAAALIDKRVADRQASLTALSTNVAQGRVSPELSSELEIAKSMLAARKEVMSVLNSDKLGNTVGFSALMAGFARQAQNDVWLTGFSISAGGEEIEIRGRLLDSARLPAYVQFLRNEPVFQGRRFAALEMRGVDPDDGKAQSPSESTRPLPRFVEFVLRSENAGPVAARSEIKQ